MYCLELIKFDVSNTSCYVDVENGAPLLTYLLTYLAGVVSDGVNSL